MSHKQKLEQLLKPEAVPSYIIVGRFMGNYAVSCKPDFYRGVQTEPVIEPGQFLMGVVTADRQMYEVLFNLKLGSTQTSKPMLFYGTRVMQKPSADYQKGTHITALGECDRGTMLSTLINGEMKEKMRKAQTHLKKHLKHYDTLREAAKTKFPKSSRQWMHIKPETMRELQAVCVQMQRYENADFLKRLIPCMPEEQPAYPIIRLPPENP